MVTNQEILNIKSNLDTKNSYSKLKRNNRMFKFNDLDVANQKFIKKFLEYKQKSRSNSYSKNGILKRNLRIRLNGYSLPNLINIVLNNRNRDNHIRLKSRKLKARTNGLSSFQWIVFKDFVNNSLSSTLLQIMRNEEQYGYEQNTNDSELPDVSKSLISDLAEKGDDQAVEILENSNKSEFKRPKPKVDVEQPRKSIDERTKESPFLGYSEEVETIFRYWRTLPEVIKTKPKISKTFHRSCKYIELKLKKHSVEEIQYIMNKYSELLQIIKSKAPQIYKQVGFRVGLDEFFSLKKGTKDKISLQAPHKHLNSWFIECKNNNLSSMTVKFSLIGRFNIDPKYESIFNLFLVYYWRWFVLKNKPRSIRAQAREILNDPERSASEIFDKNLVSMEDDFDMIELTKISQGFQGYIEYIKSRHPELLKTKDMERGVRAIFKAFFRNKNQAFFIPKNFYVEQKYTEFENMIEDEESLLAINHKIQEKREKRRVQDKLKKINKFDKERKAKADIWKKQRELTSKLQNGEKNSVQEFDPEQVRKESLSNLGQDPEKQAEEKVLEFSKKVKQRLQREHSGRAKSLHEQKRKQELQKLEDEKRKQELEETKLEKQKENQNRDIEVAKIIPEVGQIDELLDNRPTDQVSKQTENTMDQEEFYDDLNLDLIEQNQNEHDLDIKKWEQKVLETYGMYDPWNSELSWTFGCSTGEENIWGPPQNEVEMFVFTPPLDPPTIVRVWTSPNGLLFIDGDPIIRNSKDLQRFHDFQSGILRKPECYRTRADDQPWNSPKYNELSIYDLPDSLRFIKNNEKQIKDLENQGNLSIGHRIRNTVCGKDILAFSDQNKITDGKGNYIQKKNL